MTKTQDNRFKRMRILLVSLAFTIGLMIAIFKLFEPVFVFNSGWKNIPALDRTAGEQSPIPDEFAAVIASANARLDDAVTANKFPALSIAIGKDSRVVWARAMGFGNLETETPAKLDTMFRIGSVSKAVTATTAAKLVEEGILDLDAPIRRIVPYFPAKKYDITPRQLFTHTAGIRHYEFCFCFPFDEYSNQTSHDSVESAVATFADSELLFEPGTEFSYSSHGFTLAAAAMEGASGLSFDEIIAAKLTSPLSMTNTMREGLANGDIAVPYAVRDNEYKPAYPVENSNKTAGGGFVSTPADLVLMTQAILNGGYVDAATRDNLFFAPQMLRSGEVNEQNYAFGWRSHPLDGTLGEDRKVMVSHHGGIAMGGTAFLIMYPEHGISIAIMTNRQMDGVGELIELTQSIADDMILESDSK